MDMGAVVAVKRDTRSTTSVVSWVWATVDVVDCVEVSDDR